MDAYLKKGMLHLSRGKTAEVELDLVKAVKVAPELLKTRLIFSSLHESINDRAKAFATLSAGLTGKKNNTVLLLRHVQN